MMIECIIINQLVHLGCTHARMNLSFHEIKYSGIHYSTPANSFNLFRGLDKFTGRH